MKSKTCAPQPLTLLPLALMLGFTGVSNGQTTVWGTSGSLSPLGYYSDATATGNSLTWSIGYFNPGFVPTAANVSNWVANYNSLDTNTEESFDLGGGVTAYAALDTLNDGGPASYGKQAYIFAYNSLALIGLAGGEALLMRENGYLFPDAPFFGTFDIADNPGGTEDDSFDVIWGQVDRVMEGTGGVVIGGGFFTSMLADTSTNQWEAQTAAFVLIPEPSSAILVSLASLLVFRRSRK